MDADGFWFGSAELELSVERSGDAQLDVGLTGPELRGVWQETDLGIINVELLSDPWAFVPTLYPLLQATPKGQEKSQRGQQDLQDPYGHF